ncbi:MAG: sensor histidine kinase [Bacteroidetes bacterium]|nr:sensor histidine kinase [Bacteroidota bacterium]
MEAFLMLLLVGLPILSAYAQEKSYIPDNYELKNFKTDTAEINRLILQSQNTSTDSSIVFLQTAYKKSILAKYNYGAAQSLLGLGVMYGHSGAYDSSLNYYKRAYYYCYNCPEKQFRVLLWQDMASSYARSGNRNIAFICLYKALEEIKNNDLQNNRTLTATIYLNIATMLTADGQDNKALYYLRKAEALVKNRNIYLPLLYLNMANAYHASNIDSYLVYSKKELALGKKYGSREISMLAYFSIGDAYVDSKIPAKGIQYIDSGIALVTTSTNPVHIVQYNARLGEAYYQLGNFKRAKYFLDIAGSEGKRLGLTDDERFYIDTTLAAIYTREGNFQKALEKQQEYSKSHDSFLKAQKDSLINKLEVTYRTAEKDKEIASQLEGIKHRNSLIIVVSIIACLLVMLIVSMYFITKNRKQLQEEKILNLEQEKKITELKGMLQGEEKERKRLARELHDGIMGQLSAVKLSLSFLKRKYSVLNNANDFSEVLSNLDEAAKDLRNTAHNLMPATLSYHGLGAALHTFCDKINQSNELQIHFYMYGELPKLQSYFELSIYRIVQELIQNIIKHAKATEALLQINFFDEQLTITIEDNGSGFNTETVDKAAGLGLTNVRERISAFHGTFTIGRRNEGGTAIEIVFDTNYMKNEESYVNKSSNNG